jgi:C4-dicarboxylate-specific signal transduction histidine kinase
MKVIACLLVCIFLLTLNCSSQDSATGVLHISKIFQPFFTTKPTGLGIGLGLSLSYDIIKAYKGEIKMETKEGI